MRAAVKMVVRCVGI